MFQNMDTPRLCNISEGDSPDYLDWDLSNIDTSDLPATHITNPIDLYLECEDDEVYSIPQSQQQMYGPSLIGQNVHLQISFPPIQQNSHNASEFLECKDCGEKFNSDKKLKGHLKNIHKIEKPYGCTRCNYVSVCIKLLNRHVKRCLRLESTKIKDLCSLPVQLRVDVGDTTKNCEAKNAEEISSSDTSTVKPFQCNLCSFQTKSGTLLKAHVGTKHNSNRQELKCDMCEFQCMQKRTLLIHCKTHEEGSDPEVCDICKKTFVSLEKLKRHKQTHSTERPYKCSQCPSSFKFQGVLTDHIKSVHLKSVVKPNIKSVKCTWPGCKKLFRDKHNQKLHYRTHIWKL